MARREIWMIAASAVMMVVGGVGVGFWIARDNIVEHVDADAKAGVAELDEAPERLLRQAAPIYHSFDAPFTVNLKNSEAVLQVGIAMSTYFASTDDAIGEDEPALRSTILLILADVTGEMAENEAIKKQLLQKIVAASNAQLIHDGYSGNIDSADFTDFIVQGGDE